MKRIDFSHDWNKAKDAPYGKLGLKCFSTIRRAGGLYQEGDVVEVWLGDEVICTAEIVYRKHFLLHQLNEGMARMDTGYALEDCKKIITKMHGKHGDVQSMMFAFIVLARIEPKEIEPKETTNLNLEV